jgi:hypothetical protein
MNLTDTRFTKEMLFFFDNIHYLKYYYVKNSKSFIENYYTTINNFELCITKHINTSVDYTFYVANQGIFYFKSSYNTLDLFVEENIFFDILNKIVPILNIEIRENIKKEEEQNNLREKKEQEQEIKKNLILKDFLNS